MRYLLSFALIFAFFLYHPDSQTSKVTKEPFEFNGRSRSYFLFVPKTAQANAPLLLILHGSGMDGRSLVDEWKVVAEKEGVIIAAPNSLGGAGWSLETDGPAFIGKLLEALEAKRSFDSRRVYLFGYSAGAVYALQLSLLESEYFAATAVYAGAIDPASEARVAQAVRKIPVALFVSTSDPFFPISKVEATRNLLKRHGFPVKMKEFSLDDSVHGHDYFSIAQSVNRDSWNFLKGYQLASAPVFRHTGESP